ncbi:hypothetical protein Hanom_Chr11g01013511 [Helianthus anomalus]
MLIRYKTIGATWEGERSEGRTTGRSKEERRRNGSCGCSDYTLQTIEKTTGFKSEKVFNAVKPGVSFSDILLNKSSQIRDEESVFIEHSVFTLTRVIGRDFVVRTVDFNTLRFLMASLVVAGFHELLFNIAEGCRSSSRSLMLFKLTSS